MTTAPLLGFEVVSCLLFLKICLFRPFLKSKNWFRRPPKVDRCEGQSTNLEVRVKPGVIQSQYGKKKLTLEIPECRSWFWLKRMDLPERLIDVLNAYSLPPRRYSRVYLVLLGLHGSIQVQFIDIQLLETQLKFSGFFG